jgi:ADP-ribose pyrophosphatase YjhB (NUDIX family)
MPDSINRIQAMIIHRLFEQDGLRFSQINVSNLPTDQFSYHLRQLAKAEFIHKNADHTYSLSAQGKKHAIMLQPNDNHFIEQGFSAVLVIARKLLDDEWHYLLQIRDKVPYKGLIAASGDKIYYGESVQAAAERALHLQTGLTGNVALRSIWHIRDIHQSAIVQDKYFYVHTADQCRGQEKHSGLTGQNVWITTAGLSTADGVHNNTRGILQSLDSDELSFHDISYDTPVY